MKHYSVPQLAKILDVPTTTLAYRIKRFSEYIPSIKQGKHNKYTDEALEVLRIIDEQLSNGADADEIKDKLEKIYGIPINNEEETTNDKLTTINKQLSNIAMIERNTALLEELSEQQKGYAEQIKKLQETVQTISDKHTTNGNEVLSELRAVKLALEQNKTNWWGRLLRK